MEECISVFDMLKIGVGPSSSHTLGPWKAAERFLNELKDNDLFQNTIRIQVDLYGSLYEKHGFYMVLYIIVLLIRRFF